MPEKTEGGLRKTFSELNPVEDEGHNDRLLQGVVVATSDIEHYDTYHEFECPSCHKVGQSGCLTKEINFRDYKPPTKCIDCSVDLDVTKNDKGRLRKIMVQENIQENPQTLTAFLFGDNCLKTEAGDKVDIRGELVSVKKRKDDITYQRMFDINQLRKTEEVAKIPTSSEISKFEKLSFSDIITSYAPNIKGMEDIKEALLISLIGGVNTKDVRGDINTMLVGDPGTAKTKLLQFVTQIISPSAYASGRSVSAAGLLAGVDNLSDGTRVARAGVVTLCNGGVVALDEMDKMTNTDRSALHESMETQQFSLVKVGINRKWEVKTTIIGAGNPYGGNKWDPSISIKDNIRLPDSLLSRFSLIFLVLDLPDKEKDLDVARHILKVRQHDVQTILNSEELAKYINYAKTFVPIINDEAGEILLKWWADLRAESQPDKAPAIDHRVMEDLNRLTEAYARSRFSNEGKKEDALAAINILQKSLQTMGMKTPGELAVSSFYSLDKDGWTKHVFEKPISHNQAVLDLCKRKAYYKTRASAEISIKKLLKEHRITEGVNGELVWQE